MPLSLQDLANERREISVEIRNVGSIALRYKPNALTPAREAELRRLAEDEEDAEEADAATSSLLLDLIEEWDLAGPMYDLHGNEIVPPGVTVPLERGFIKYVPSRVQMQILRDIGKDANPDPNGRGRSAGRSRRED